MKFEKVILASQSARRTQLLQWAEIPFEVAHVETDESYPDHLSPSEVAIHIAFNKAFTAERNSVQLKTNGNGYPILAADTIVVLESKIIGKPSGREQAVKMLAMLSGRTHSVITGVCILSGEKKIVFADETKVEFLTLTQFQIDYYVNKYKPYDKAGAYAIQEWIGVTGIRSITGDFYNVMGLPVSRVLRELQALG